MQNTKGGNLIRRLRQENWELNNKLRAAEKRLVELTYVSRQISNRKEGYYPSEVVVKALKVLNDELIKRIQKAEPLSQLNGEREKQEEATEANKESDQAGDGLYVERGESDPEE
jgi:hypothetical protein